MPPKAEHTVHILEGKATLYKREGTPFWHLRYKVYGKWHRQTTKQTVLKKAKSTAVEIYADSTFRERNSLPPNNKRFKAVANLAIRNMDELTEAKQGKVTYETYTQVINNYLIPFFGNYNIDKVDHALILKFARWRIQEMKREPSASVINNHNSALNRVFDEALKRGYLAKIQVPLLVNDGVKSHKRDDFTIEEYTLLYKGMRQWLRQARQGNERELRQILREYVLVLANTGIRAGTEGMSIKWKNIKFFYEQGVRYLAIDVSGKTGKREVIARHSVVRYLDRLRKYNPKYARMTFEEFVARRVDEYVFRDAGLSGDYMTSKFGRMFKRLLESLELLKHSRTDKPRTLYSLRHTYATLALAYNRMSVHTLSEHLSTSVKMIEDYYGHVLLRRKAHEIAGKLTENHKVKY
jgi:integrase